MLRDERYVYLYDSIQTAKAVMSDALGYMQPHSDSKLINHLIVISDNMSQITNSLDFELDKFLECCEDAEEDTVYI
jgi:hypothetical protein